MGGKIGLAIAGLVGVAVGLLGGLLIAAVSSESLTDVTAERDRLKVELVQAKRNFAKTTGADEPDVPVEMVPVAELEAARAEAAHATAVGKEFAGWHLQTLAIIHMCVESNMLPLLQRDDFRERFKPEWYFPGAAFDLIGGRWFLDELLAEKVIDQAQHDLIVKDFAAAATADKSVQSQPLKKWRGTGMKTTDLFLVRARKWKLCWRSDEGMAVMVHRPNGDIVTTGSGTAGAGSTVVHEGTAEFYLDIMATGGAYEVWAEEL